MCFYCVRNHWDGVYSCIWVCFWVDHRCFMRFPALWLFVSFTCFELWGIFLYCANPSIVALSALLLLVVQLSDVSVYLVLDRRVYIHVISVKISFNAIPYFSFSVLLFVIGDLSPSLIVNADCISQCYNMNSCFSEVSTSNIRLVFIANEWSICVSVFQLYILLTWSREGAIVTLPTKRFDLINHNK